SAFEALASPPTRDIAALPKGYPCQSKALLPIPKLPPPALPPKFAPRPQFPRKLPPPKLRLPTAPRATTLAQTAVTVPGRALVPRRALVLRRAPVQTTGLAPTTVRLQSLAPTAQPRRSASVAARRRTVKPLRLVVSTVNLQHTSPSQARSALRSIWEKRSSV